MKRLLLCLTLLMLTIPMAQADFPDRVREDMPALTITVTEDAFTDGADRPYTLTAHITAEDGSLVQDVSWHSSETPNRERAAALVLLVDYNFDGYCDLQLLTAQGARNVFYVFALWDPETGRFDEVMPGGERLPGGNKCADAHPLEVCNPTFRPESSSILSIEEDGWRYRTETVIYWESPRSQYQKIIASVYDAGNGLIGESLDFWGTGLIRMWDQVYPESWYYGTDGEGASGPRADAIALFTRGERNIEPRWAQVANVDWVNLRQLDSKASASLAHLDHGAAVQVLREGCGTDSGWVLVWVDNAALGLPTGGADMYQDTLVDGMTGYIWHSFLEETEY